MPTRRAFLCTGIAAAQIARAATAPVLGASKVISTQPEYYHGWPTVALRRNGEILTVYSGGREAHICPFGRVELIRSRDEGRTWTWPEVIMDSPIDDRDAGVVETPAGSLLVTTSRRSRMKPCSRTPVAGRPNAWNAGRQPIAAYRRNSASRSSAPGCFAPPMTA